MVLAVKRFGRLSIVKVVGIYDSLPSDTRYQIFPPILYELF